MGSPNQPRDWRGRWTTSGGGAFRPSNSRVARGGARVTRIRNGKATRPGRIGARLATNGPIRRKVGLRPGVKLNKSGTVRFVSPTHAVTRATPIGWTEFRAAGRVTSAYRVNRSRSQRTAPNGYIVAYPPKG